jgi:acylglycerol lipase
MSVIFTVDKFTSYDNTSLRYGVLNAEREGSGQQPIVFVPGLGGSVKNAINFLEQFVPHHGPVYSVDARGFGLNEKLDPQPNPGHYLQDLHQFVLYLQQQHHLKSDDAPLIFGLSLGGVFATLYATQFTHPFTGVVLISPAFEPHPKIFTTSFKLKNYLQVLLKGTGAMTTMPYGIHDITRNPEKYNDPNFQDPLIMPTLYLFMVDIMCRKASRQMRNITLPTAVIIPEQDLICNPHAMKRMFDRIPHPRKALFSYPNLYHDIMMEPDEDLNLVCGDINTWITDLGLVKVSTE